MSARVDVFLPPWAKPFLSPARWKSMRGGRGSSKSHTAAQINILRMAGLLGEFGYSTEPVRIASCRDFNVNLGTSVKVAVEKYIHIMGLADQFDIQNLAIKHNNGSIMTFHGVTNNPDSFLSMDDIDVFWMEQAETLGDEMVKIAPTIRKPGSELQFIWNPNLRTDYCWNRFIINPQPGDLSVRVNYDEWEIEDRRSGHMEVSSGKPGNPWWTAELEETRKYYEQTEPSLYAWMYLGEPNDGDATHQVLPYIMVKACVDAWDMRPRGGSLICDFGFDIAEGGRDKCATVGRIGPTVLHFDQWPGVAGDPDPAAERAANNMDAHPVTRVYYDSSSPMRGPLLRQGRDFGITGVNFGGSVGGKDFPYERGRTNGDVFSARNVQMAQALRLRATRTIQLMNGQEVDPAACLFIDPTLPQLGYFLASLTQPIRRVSPVTGRWELDKRGGDENAESPDPFDALCLAFARDSDHGLRARL